MKLTANVLSFAILFLIFSFSVISAHTANTPSLFVNWALSGLNPFDYNTDFKVNTFDFLIDTHPGQPHPTAPPTPTPDPNQPWPQIQLTSYISNLNNPVAIVDAHDNSQRLFILEQSGRIRIIKNSQLLTSPFLDISNRITCCGERGLLGLAFPPNYSTSGVFYLNYTNLGGHTTISRFHVNPSNPDLASPNEEILLNIDQPFANHNGGSLAFGPDGYLYIGMGDGGSGGDPGNRAQNLNEYLGKMLRIDVSGASSYAIPPTNPFFNNSNARKEIWALGLRNPWKFSFDSQTGDLYIADVGEGQREEINFQLANSSGGQNYGWHIMEGKNCFNPSTNCNQTGLTLPIIEYGHTEGNCSVTGGYVYRGTQFPSLQGIYLYGDYCSGRIWGARKSGSQWQTQQLLDTSHTISSFGQDQSANLYLTDYSAGTILKITAVP